MKTNHFIAFDLGATSGRTILGTLTDDKLTLKELTRFPNQILSIGGHLHWDIYALYQQLLQGLKAASAEGVAITSIGIDTWGVDFAFVGDDGALLGLPYSYRDPHTQNAPAEFFKEKLPKEELYQRTGIQQMPFNTLFQLYALQQNGSSQLRASEKLLFLPDALAYLLTGKLATEYTIASTSQLIDPYTRQLDSLLLQKVGLSVQKFAPLVTPGTPLGILQEAIARECGLPQIPVISVAGHDTASAVAAVPAQDKKFAYLSSGTWSLMGIEVEDPIISAETNAWNISNEGGILGTIRLLKNITGMWILEQCLKEWQAEGKNYTYPRLIEMAQAAAPFKCFIDPDHALFSAPAHMQTAIASYCRETGQSAPQNDSSLIRMLFESLALKYRYVFELFQKLAPEKIERLHIIGGGSKNKLLNAFTANALGVEVVAGPSEATAIGNLLLQAYALGRVDSLSTLRKLCAASVETERFTPTHSHQWEAAYQQYLQTTHLL